MEICGPNIPVAICWEAGYTLDWSGQSVTQYPEHSLRESLFYVFLFVKDTLLFTGKHTEWLFNPHYLIWLILFFTNTQRTYQLLIWYDDNVIQHSLLHSFSK